MGKQAEGLQPGNLRHTRSSNLVLDLKIKMWEKLESKLPMCKSKWGGGSNLNLSL